MRDHPLTPMRDPSLVRVLQRQTRHKVGLVPYATVTKGAQAISAAFAELQGKGFRHAVIDAVGDGDLLALGAAVADLKLITGGSGIAPGLPEDFRRARPLARTESAHALPIVRGAAAGLSRPSSPAHLGPVPAIGTRRPGLRL